MNANPSSQMESDTLHKLYIFDIFLAEKGQDDLKRVRNLGIAAHGDGHKTYKISLKTLINSDFYLIRENENNFDYLIMTRETSRNTKRKYFWHVVGEGKLVSIGNSSYVNLKWDLFPTENIYMDLHPKHIKEVSGQNISEVPT